MTRKRKSEFHKFMDKFMDPRGTPVKSGPTTRMAPMQQRSKPADRCTCNAGTYRDGDVFRCKSCERPVDD